MTARSFLLLGVLLLSGATHAQPSATSSPAAAGPAAPRPVEVDRIVAIAGSEAITLVELRSRMQAVERQLRAQNQPLPPPEVLREKLLENMILDRLQLQLARETGLRIGESELDAALQRIANNNRLSLADFRAAIERDGLSWSKFRDDIRTEMLLARLRERELDSRVTVSESEIDGYLAGEVATDEQVRLAHIIVRVPEQADAQTLAQRRSRAEEALARLKQGEDFAQVAARYSDAPDGLSGGAMAQRPIDRLPALYADAVRNLKVGEHSAILRSPAGFHILKLLGRENSALPTQALKQTHARHILIKVNELVGENEARHKLLTLKERLDNGADFAELARLHSQDLSAAKGGDLGWLYEGDTVPEFERAMNALKPNEISAPVRSPFGWHLIQVLERRTEDASPERKRLLARQALRERKLDEAYEDWLRQLRDRSHVEIRLDTP